MYIIFLIFPQNALVHFINTLDIITYISIIISYYNKTNVYIRNLSTLLYISILSCPQNFISSFQEHFGHCILRFLIDVRQ